ncbi:MAG: sulfur oxidation c-type cytochrome SoxX [gamma proteobacterium symbiont of Bathyaustriella thionipta]|nr:sulfur oxidation c-type cytochrome SoxX [gamma proteobacterium symbiont of Bathyaustriella thionipta]MCU7949826.1 sulfur oxidation c-type cytochrome SoxX [gamma proteobacterium symbiont of Bathyaustriella thionipta]MCU7952692.1 sulfur oxidation c-type cytochrome SoxX [gamma proteobacterium symbiont of Bathyaustriella thionipta]MCU7956570.1 sulfur oxidation c-type cytochrome SoxX [gamma proteobacterium symbiont of Bathyaustriella thionipta]MCU7967138.1 sulfur oxidation c-type cytochrome SoxX 
MNRKSKGLLGLASALLVGVSLSSSAALAADAGSKLSSNIEEGKKLSFSRPKGNCLACHMIKDGASPGNIAPPLIVMKTRFPDRQVLKDQIFDASKRNPETSMPLFGRYEILSEEELDKVVDYIYSL